MSDPESAPEAMPTADSEIIHMTTELITGLSKGRFRKRLSIADIRGVAFGVACLAKRSQLGKTIPDTADGETHEDILLLNAAIIVIALDDLAKFLSEEGN